MTLPRHDEIIKLPDGRRLAYAEYGDANGRAVFLFHGLPGSRLSWGLLPGDPIPAGLRIIAPDRPGYGRSDSKPHRTLLDWAEDVEQLADGLGIAEFAIVGVSGGGPGALACAWKIPNRVTSVGIVSSPAPTDAPGVFEGMSKTNRFFIKLAWRAPWLSSLNARFLAKMIRRNPARSVVLWTRGARTYSYLLAFAGILAVLIHGGLLAAGTPQFRSPASLALLAATLILSVWQIATVMRCRNDASR